jgi:hypothetical protein
VKQFETGDTDFKVIQAHLQLGNRLVIGSVMLPRDAAG